MNVLISLHKGYGLGDAVQMSAVLKHVRKYRPDWVIDYQAEAGKHGVGRGIIDKTFAYGDPQPRDHYDAEVQIRLYAKWPAWEDRPNTRVATCLRDCFDIDWDEECGRYQVEVSKYATQDVQYMIDLIRREHFLTQWRLPPMVALHYEGHTLQESKNLSHDQAVQICRAINRTGRVTLLLDWENRSPIPNLCTHYLDAVLTVGRFPQAKRWGATAEANCATIKQCDAFIGIDSGPGKCASATDVPTLIIWTKLHPAQYHDPAPNTTHLVPYGFHEFEPVCCNQGVIDWFAGHYNLRFYGRGGEILPAVEKWLQEVLK